MFRNLTVALMAFLTLVDLFATQAILPYALTAGQSAALQLARARRKVLVVDSGKRRNRFADESHGFLTQDGVDDHLDDTVHVLILEQFGLAFGRVVFIWGQIAAGQGAIVQKPGGAQFFQPGQVACRL